jgi:hypothetical protein
MNLDSKHDRESYLAELAQKASIGDDKWCAWVRELAFTRDLNQLPMGDQDRVFRVVA